MNEDEIGPPSCNCCCWMLTLPFAPCVLCCSSYTLVENHEAVVLECGKLNGIEKEPGCKVQHCCCSDVKMVSKMQTSLSLPTTKIIDLNGNPLNVSGVVVYSIENTKKAILDVQDYHSFIVIVSTAILKHVVSRYPYENWDEENPQVCLKDEPEEIPSVLVKALQKKVALCGARIHSFKLNEISYSTEISQSMLKRQKAEAVVHARKTIVDGASDIVFDAIDELTKKGVTFSPEEKTKLVSDLLITMCSEARIQPTLNLNN